MDSDDLRVFEAVARHGAMNRAAQEMHMVQSNVTARIRTLEADLGATLFHRHSRGVALTAAGERLLPFAERSVRLLKEARAAVTGDGAPAGPLVVGTLETTAAIRLSRPIGAFLRHHPEVDLVLRTGTTADMIDAVLTRQVDGALVCGPVAHPDLRTTPMFAERLVLVTRPGLYAGLDLAGLADQPVVVLRAGCSYRLRLEEILARRGLAPVRRLEFGTIEALVGCVAAGLGVTLLPEALLEAAVREGRVAVHVLPAAEALVETLFVRRADQAVTPTLAAFLDCIALPELVRAAE
ncbi:MAG: LysR family transcriptional regulator [Pseudomonadota bacterium]|nr:LysR family transcriptional regulator [Pseudomonadota bacterium]